MALMFSSSSEDVINRGCDLTEPSTLDTYNISEFYEISRCITWINACSFSKVALQFPDNLLKDAADVVSEFKKQTQAEIYVLGDTSYGSCCVDEIAAEHVQADAIIHFGHACLSQTNRLPVLYIFGKFPLDMEDVKLKFTDLFKDKESDVLVFCDVYYVHAMENLKASLIVEYKNLVFAEYNHLINSNTDCDNRNSSEQVAKTSRTLPIPESKTLSSYSAFYIGSQEQTLMNIMLSYNCCKFSSYDPKTRLARHETLDVNKYLRKRYYYIERIKDAKIVGILVGTLGVSNYLTIINHLRTLAKSSGKKAYVLAVGKLNAAKLANFPEIDVFVYVSCPESVLVTNRDFYQPIVTPFEMEIACNQARSWTGNYVTDFGQLLPGACDHVPLDVSQKEISDVSLVTGKMRSLGTRLEQEAEEAGNKVLIRDSMTVASIHENAAGEHLAGRSWKGLEPCLGQTPVSSVVQGKQGIAMEYEGERDNAE